MRNVYGQGEKYYLAIDAYEEVNNPEEWLNCPNCGLKPLVWEFDNGRSTACACGENKHNHFKIEAESIVSITKRTGGIQEYNPNQLKENWNHWVKTGKKS